MTLTHTPGAMKRFRKTAWPFQRTIQTPPDGLHLFVSTICSGHRPIRSASVVIDEKVMDPGHHVVGLLASYALPAHYAHDWTITAIGPQEAEVLLCAVFSDWIDFVFIPTPKSFAIYADHDEYTTFYAHTKSNLNHVAEPILAKGFREIRGYRREI